MWAPTQCIEGNSSADLNPSSLIFSLSSSTSIITPHTVEWGGMLLFCSTSAQERSVLADTFADSRVSHLVLVFLFFSKLMTCGLKAPGTKWVLWTQELVSIAIIQGVFVSETASFLIKQWWLSQLNLPIPYYRPMVALKTNSALSQQRVAWHPQEINNLTYLHLQAHS